MLARLTIQKKIVKKDTFNSFSADNILEIGSKTPLVKRNMPREEIGVTKDLLIRFYCICNYI